MTRQLTITAAEWASVQDGTLWLVREGDDCACSSDGGTWAGGGGFALSCPICHDADSVPPAEFMQTAAPCVPSAPWHERAHAGCNYLPGHFSGGALYCNKCGWAAPCPDCRIELVGPSDACLNPDPMHCAVTLGHAYPVGSPLPIYDLSDQGHIWPALVILGIHRIIYAESATSESWLADGDLLAHAGPVEWLVGKWAIELRVVGS